MCLFYRQVRGRNRLKPCRTQGSASLSSSLPLQPWALAALGQTIHGGTNRSGLAWSLARQSFFFSIIA
jgi:hypothetical protein